VDAFKKGVNDLFETSGSGDDNEASGDDEGG